MKLRMTWFLGGCALAVLGGMNAMACSSSSTPITGTDSGGGGQDTGSGSNMDTSMPGNDTGPKTDGGGGSETSPSEGGGPTDAAADCKKVTLHENAEAGVYCPFSGVDGGKAITCTGGQICCETPENDAGLISTCESAGTTCPVSGSAVWGCEGPVDCTAAGSAGPLCCLTASAIVPEGMGCTYDYVSHFGGTACATSCPTGQFTVCEADGDCPSGMMCVPTTSKGNQFGVCQ
jgi:hypothetical protein